MVDEAITVERRKGPSWEFKKESSGIYLCRQRKAIYRLFWEPIGTCKPCWIARLSIDKKTWFTVEREIRAVAVVFSFGRYVFD